MLPTLFGNLAQKSPISLVAHVGAAIGSSGGASGAIDTTGAKLLILVLCCANTAIPTVSDSKGNTWIGLTAQNEIHLSYLRLFYAKAPTVGSGHTFSVSAVASSVAAIAVAAFSGADIVSPFDQQNGNQGRGSSLATGSITPSVDNELVVVGAGSNDNGTYTPGTGYTTTDAVTRVPGVNQFVALSYLIQTAKAATNPTVAVPNASLNNSACVAIASFKRA